MEYTSKDVCRYFNFKRDTLRLYEQLGIVHPRVDPDNRYRYYDEWDIYAIAECKKSQTLGMSLKTISHFQNEGSLPEYIAHTQKQQQVIQKQADFYALLALKNEAYIEKLGSIPQRLNRCEVVDVPDAYFVPSIKSTAPFIDPAALDMEHFAFNNYAFFDNGLRIPLADYYENTGVFTWGLMILKQYADKISAPISGTEYIPASKAVRCLIDAGERGSFVYRMFDPILEYAAQNGFTPLGTIYGTLLTRVYQQGRYCRYFDIDLPVRIP